ncbi:hypothetical protein NE237_020194 [Protea cynaroides]|uniref:Uncharacterized protein n=1 Tax=Protea cynaroides TaxID=273540 RepID=A0A9Q0H6S8_9MAGN|nr:hypothetical protein NE237_020194 [Protea cynaroides]
MFMIYLQRDGVVCSMKAREGERVIEVRIGPCCEASSQRVIDHNPIHDSTDATVHGGFTVIGSHRSYGASNECDGGGRMADGPMEILPPTAVAAAAKTWISSISYGDAGEAIFFLE